MDPKPLEPPAAFSSLQWRDVGMRSRQKESIPEKTFSKEISVEYARRELALWACEPNTGDVSCSVARGSGRSRCYVSLKKRRKRLVVYIGNKHTYVESITLIAPTKQDRFFLND